MFPGCRRINLAPFSLLSAVYYGLFNIPCCRSILYHWLSAFPLLCHIPRVISKALLCCRVVSNPCYYVLCHGFSAISSVRSHVLSIISAMFYYGLPVYPYCVLCQVYLYSLPLFGSCIIYNLCYVLSRIICIHLLCSVPGLSVFSAAVLCLTYYLYSRIICPCYVL